MESKKILIERDHEKMKKSMGNKKKTTKTISNSKKWVFWERMEKWLKLKNICFVMKISKFCETKNKMKAFSFLFYLNKGNKINFVNFQF